MQGSLQPLKEAQCARVARGPFPATSPSVMCSCRDPGLQEADAGRFLQPAQSLHAELGASGAEGTWMVWEGCQPALGAPPSSGQPRACPGEVSQGPQDSLGSPGCGCVNRSHPAKSGSGHLSPSPNPAEGKRLSPPAGHLDVLITCPGVSGKAALPSCLRPIVPRALL